MMTMMVAFDEIPMNEKMNVAEAKKKFSEILARTAFNGKRFIINRRGKPMAVLIGLEDFAFLEERTNSSEKTQGLLATAGALTSFDNFEEIMSDVYRSRGRAGLMYLFDTDTRRKTPAADHDGRAGPLSLPQTAPDCRPSPTPLSMPAVDTAVVHRMLESSMPSHVPQHD